MIDIDFVFWLFVILFAIIGGMRGWAKELLVGFSVILALFVLTVLYNYLGFVYSFLSSDATFKFWADSIILVALSFFGYQTPNIERFKAAARREKLQDILFGLVLGAVNGYLIVGSIWYFLDKAQYFFSFVTPPQTDAARRLVEILPPVWLDAPAVYFAVAIAFTFVVIVFI
jgi:uncharacterized membrane protein required for colicin V production